MTHPLEQKIVALRRRARRTAAVYGLCVAAAAAIGTVAALGSIDYLLRLQDRGLRIIASLAALGGIGWSFYRCLWTTILWRVRNAELALRLERQFPELNDRLLSAFELLHQAEDDPTTGSAALRRAAVAETAAVAQPLDFAAVLDRRPTLRAAAVLAAACLAAGILMALDPSAARIALARLVNPFGGAAWPQKARPTIIRPEAVEPPKVESLSVKLIPPAYTGWPPAPAERHIRALAGTKVQITGKAAGPLKSAALCIEGGPRIAARLGDDRTFAVDFTANQSGAYWFELTDRQGITGGDDDRWEMRVAPDSPPTVGIERPTANLFVAPRAVIPIRVAARDDLALAKIVLVFRRDESGPEETVLLWAASPRPNLEGTPDGDRRIVDYRWELGPLELKPGTRVTFYAAADDYLPQTGRSEPRSLTVVTADELHGRIADREKLILAELERALRIERGCRGQVESLRTRLAEMRPLDQAEVDRLQVVGHNQREAEHVLTSREEGVPMHVLALLADLENNRLPSQQTHRRMSALLEEIDRLGREHLPAIGRELGAAVKTAQVELEGQGRGGQSEEKVAASLAAAAGGQDAVIAALTQIVGQLARWDSYRRFHREIGQLLHDQDEVAHRTSQLGRRTIARELRDLAPQDAAELNSTADRQLELARLLDRVLQEMDQAAGQLRQDDAAAATLVAEAIDLAHRSAIGGQMRSAGGQIQQNRIGQAAGGQKQIGRDLQGVLDILANRDRQTDADRSRPTVSHTPDGAPEQKAGRGDGQPAGEESTASASPGAGGEGNKHKLDVNEMRTIMKRLWGELPEHARQQMLQSPIEQFPPKYELMIEHYYRRLSAESRKR